MRPIDLNNVQEAQEFKKVKPGGYVCEMTAIEDVPNKEYLRIEFDIARIIVNGIGSASALEVSSPYDQYWWDLSIPEKDNNSLINIVNYNDIPL